ncbi:helicase associated domain-containing protein [Mycobacterium hubeiense]|uniref:helicase associated domain-containing protein n=1 Tax=Mycobacterium hubeiense TaxID=1867256 RepID=UPI000C7F65F4|nr:helicase associated domain-containing protein [Mycobacterium sp. QGD 101]
MAGRWDCGWPPSCCRYRDGELAEWLRDELSRRPGWQWEPLSAEDDAGLEAYRSFVAWEGHNDIPADAVENDYPLGKWVASVRRRRVLGTLAPVLALLLVAAAPIDRHYLRRFAWHPQSTWWAINLDAARQYISRTQTLLGMPDGHCELLEGRPIAVSQWMSRMRHQHKRGLLSDEQIAELQALPGWQWTAAPIAERVEPGSPEACSNFPCPRRARCRGLCGACYEEQRTAQLAAGTWTSSYVDAAPVREHVIKLKERGIGRRRLAALAGVNDKASATLLNARSARSSGPRGKVLVTTAAKRWAVEIPDAPHHGSVADRTPVPAETSRVQLRAVVETLGGSRAEAYRRCGISVATGTSVLTGRSQQVTAATARRIERAYTAYCGAGTQ